MRAAILTLICCALATSAIGACGGSSGATAADAAPAPDAGATDQGPAGDLTSLPSVPDMGCYPKATTYLQLLNACTNAMSIDKTAVTPLLNKDGTLPPLP